MKTSGKSWAKYIDKSIKAKKVGWRKSSETGERYYEARPDHSDSNPKERYAKGGMMQHGLEVGDYITDDIRIPPNKEGVEVINIPNREQGNVWLNKGQRDVEEFAKGGMMAKGGSFKFKKIYEVGIDNDDEGTRTLADFKSEKDAKNFLYEYQLKHPKAKLFIDSVTSDFMNENKQFAKGGKTNESFTYDIRSVMGVENKGKSNEKFRKIWGGEVLQNGKEVALLEFKYYSQEEATIEAKKISEKLKSSKMAKGGKTKKAKEPMIVRGYFEDEAIDYAKGGAMDDLPKAKRERLDYLQSQEDIDSLTPIQNKEYEALVVEYRKTNKYKKAQLNKYAKGGLMGGFNYSIGGL